MPRQLDSAQVYSNNLSSFWTELFASQDILEALYRAAHNLLSDTYLDAQHEALSSGLATTPPFTRHYQRTFVFDRDQLRLAEDGSYRAPIPTDVVSVPTLANRAVTPTRVLELGRDYTIDRDNAEIVFVADPFEDDAFAAIPARRPVTDVVSGTDAYLLTGVVPGHYQYMPDTGTAINDSEAERATLRSRGAVYTVENCVLNGNTAWVKAPYRVFTADDIGRLLVVSTPVYTAATITAVLSAQVVALDTNLGMALGEMFSVEVRRAVTFEDRFAGFTVILQDLDNSDNDGVYTISEVLSADSVLLDRPITVRPTALKLHSGCTRTGTTVSIATATTRIVLADGERWAHLSDAQGNYGWFEIDEVTSFNLGNYATDVVLLDPDAALPAFDSASLTLSVHSARVDRHNAHYTVSTPASVPRLRLYGSETLSEESVLSDKYGVLVGRERASSVDYQNLLLGIYLYFWGGPSVGATRSALNTMAGFPIVRTDGELLLRVDIRTTGDVVVTDVDEYVLPTGLIREDLLDTSNWGVYVFRRLEHLSRVFHVEDLYVDPTWYYGLTVPEAVMPDEEESRRRISPTLTPTVFGGPWQFGDPGVTVGGSPDGTVYPDARPAFHDAYIDSDGISLTFAATSMSFEYAGKTIYLSGRRRSLSALTGDYTAELSEPLDIRLMRWRMRPGTVGVVGAAVIALTGHEFDPDTAPGTTLRLASGDIYLIASIGSDRSEAIVTELDGSAPTLVPDAAAVIELPITGYIQNRRPMRASAGLATFARYAASNAFGLRYDATSALSSFVSLQQDIEDIIQEGRPAHTILMNRPYAAIQDSLDMADALDRVTVGILEDMVAVSRPLAFSGTPSWSFGDFFFYANRQIRADRRFALVASGALPADPTAIDEYAVFDATDCTELFVSLYKDTVDAAVDLDVYVWDGASWANTGHTVSLDTAGLSFDGFVPPPGYLYFKQRALTTNPAAYTVGSRRGGLIKRWSTANHPSGTAMSCTSGLDEYTTAELDFFVCDVGTTLQLRIPSGTTYVQKTARIVEVLSVDTVRLVDAFSNAALSAPLTSAAVSWKMTAQRRWGQTPLAFGDQLDPSLSPPSPGPGSGMILELPVAVRFIDDI